MQTLDRTENLIEANQPSTTSLEYWHRISEEMNILYLLSFLLTADSEKAEQCFEMSLDRFVERADDFIQWSRSGGRDAVLEYATRMMKPDPDVTENVLDLSEGLFCSAREHIFEAIVLLPVFERFVFVITGIYGKSEIECARLLGAPRWKVAISRELTEQVLTPDLDEGLPPHSMPSARFEGAYLSSPRCSSC